MRNVVLFFVLLFYAAFSTTCLGQAPAFYTINNENGAPTNEVYRVVEDREGYIWIGSNAGLFKYNGSEFVAYTCPSQNSRALSFLQEDGKGRMWSKNFFGQIFRVEGTQQKLILDFKTADPNYPQFAVDEVGNLFVNVLNSIVKYDENGKRLATSTPIGLNEEENVVSVFVRDGLIIGLTDQLRLFELDKSTMKCTKALKHHALEKKIGAVNAFVDHQGALHLFIEENLSGRAYSVYKVSDDLSLTVVASLDELGLNERIHGIYSDGSKLWAYGSEGAFTLEDPNFRLFQSNRISHLQKDAAGMLWFSSLDDGLLVIPELKVTTLSAKNSALQENYITCSHAIGSNELILGTYNGNLYRYQPLEKKVTPIYSSSEESFIAVKKIGGYKNFILVSRGRLCIIDKNTGKQHLTNFSNVRDFCFKGDVIYLVFHQFIIKMPFSELFKKESKYTLLSKDGGKEIEFDSRHNKMMISTSKGTYWLDEKDRWEEVRRNGKPLFSTTLSYNNGIMWVGTVSDGLFGFERDKQRFHYSKENALSENVILALKASGPYVWACTDKYVYRIDLSKNKLERFGTNLCLNPSDILHLESSGDKVYLSTNKALFTAPIHLRLSNKSRPRLQVTGVENQGKSLQLNAVLRLDHNNSNVKFYISSLLLKNRGDYRIEYKLEGLSSNWEAVLPTSESILFPQIPSGDYKLRLRIIDPYGGRTELPAQAISVSFPIYKLWWFYVLLVLFIMGLAFLLVRKRIRYIQRKEEAKNQLIQSQLTALKVQMNPHFMFNTLNSLQDLILRQDFKNTNYYLSKYASLMRLILENSERNEIGVDEELEMLDTYLMLEKLRFGDDFNFEIQCPDDFIDQNYQIPPMIIQPYVENAIKHGLLHQSGEKRLTVCFTEEENHLKCTVTDNGIGRHASHRINERQGKSHQSFSSKATDRRLRLMQNFHNKVFNVKIIDLMENGQTGTQVILYFSR